MRSTTVTTLRLAMTHSHCQGFWLPLVAIRGADTNYGHDERDVSYAPQSVAPARGNCKPEPCQHQPWEKIPLPIDQKTQALLNVANLGGLMIPTSPPGKMRAFRTENIVPFPKSTLAMSLPKKSLPTPIPFISCALREVNGHSPSRAAVMITLSHCLYRISVSFLYYIVEAETILYATIN